MGNTVIKVEGLSKRYLIGKENSGSFRDTLTSLVRKNKAYEEFWAVKDLNFEIKEGESVAFIGKNGAGKSTLLKMLSRITKPTEGRIEISGRVSSLLEVGTGFHPELTGRENIFLNGTILGMKRSEVRSKFDEIVEFSGVGKFLDTPVKRYSSGMYVRLAFAVAAHLEPEILIIDEVLSVGDAEFQKKCLGKMDDASKSGRTVLFVSHNMSAVEKLCNRGILMQNGTLAFSGNTSEAISKYLNFGSGDDLIWERKIDGDSEIFFNKIKVYQEGRKDITTSGKLKIEFEYEVKEKLEKVNLHVALLDNYGEVIFSSAPEDSGVKKPLNVGIFNAKVTFPEDLLVSKNYSLKLILWDQVGGGFKHYDVNEEIKFRPVETDSLINVTKGGRSGIIALKCDWQIN